MKLQDLQEASYHRRESLKTLAIQFNKFVKKYDYEKDKVFLKTDSLEWKGVYHLHDGMGRASEYSTYSLYFFYEVPDSVKREVALAGKCKYCGAARNQPCETSKGTPTKKLHGDRFKHNARNKRLMKRYVDVNHAIDTSHKILDSHNLPYHSFPDGNKEKYEFGDHSWSGNLVINIHHEALNLSKLNNGKWYWAGGEKSSEVVHDVNYLQEAKYLSTEFVELVSELLGGQKKMLHSRYIDIAAVPDAIEQLTKVFGEPHINKGGIKDEHGLGKTIPRVSGDNSFVAYSWENVPGARYVALDVYTDGRSDTAEIFVDRRGER